MATDPARHDKLVWDVLAKEFPTTPWFLERDDLFSYGALGLQRATKSFDSSRGARFSTFAWHCIRNAVTDGLRREFHQAGHTVPMSSYQDELYGESRDESPDPEPSALDGIVDAELLDGVLNMLDHRLAPIVQLHLVDGLTVSETASALGCSQRTVERDLRDALDTIRSSGILKARVKTPSVLADLPLAA